MYARTIERRSVARWRPPRLLTLPDFGPRPLLPPLSAIYAVTVPVVDLDADTEKRPQPRYDRKSAQRKTPKSALYDK